jgi:hypothetical protein
MSTTPTQKLENKIAFQIGFLIYSNKCPDQVIKDLVKICIDYCDSQLRQPTANYKENKDNN